MATETFTTIDKAKRDELYAALRRSQYANEREVVKFSGVEEVPDTTVITRHGLRKVYRSTWSVAYPAERPEVVIRKHTGLPVNLKEETTDGE